MRAALYEAFQGPVDVTTVADPEPAPHGVVLEVGATGICRSDWHGWMGHDPDIRLPHVPGHELAGTVAAAGAAVRNFRSGDRVTVPFVCACGDCPQCRTGNQQICDRQTQPGFTHWGSYAQYVALEHADVNLVALPDDVDFATAASLGCRFGTAYRAVTAQGRVGPEQWLAVHGCGGVGLSAVMIGAALGARVVAVDVDGAALAAARDAGAECVVDARGGGAVVDEIVALTGGGAHVSIDALGSAETSSNSVACLRKRGRHVQVGLLAGDDYRPRLPMELVVARELEIVGSHGLQASEYARVLDLIAAGTLDPASLVRQKVSLEQAAAGLGRPDALRVAGVTVIDRF